MSAQKWRDDLVRVARNRAHRVSREELDADSLFYREEDAALNSMVDGVPVVFDFTKGTVTPPGPLVLQGHAVPLRTMVRDDDPRSSVEAALSVKASNGFLLQCIRGEVERADGPLDAFEISLLVLKHHPTKWALDTIRTAVSRAKQAGLIRVADELGSRGSGKKKRRVRRYEIANEETQ